MVNMVEKEGKINRRELRELRELGHIDKIVQEIYSSPENIFKNIEKNTKLFNEKIMPILSKHGIDTSHDLNEIFNYIISKLS